MAQSRVIEGLVGTVEYSVGGADRSRLLAYGDTSDAPASMCHVKAVEPARVESDETDTLTYGLTFACGMDETKLSAGGIAVSLNVSVRRDGTGVADLSRPTATVTDASGCQATTHFMAFGLGDKARQGGGLPYPEVVTSDFVRTVEIQAVGEVREPGQVVGATVESGSSASGRAACTLNASINARLRFSVSKQGIDVASRRSECSEPQRAPPR